MRILIKSIPSIEQRYSTSGDYWIDKDGTWQIRVSQMPDRSMLAVIIHELVEMALVMDREIPLDAIDRFDMEHEQSGTGGEPGAQAEAPYFEEHATATAIETAFCNAIGLPWGQHEDNVEEAAEQGLKIIVK